MIEVDEHPKRLWVPRGRSFFCLGVERLSRSVLRHVSGDYLAPYAGFPAAWEALSIAHKVFSEVG